MRLWLVVCVVVYPKGVHTGDFGELWINKMVCLVEFCRCKNYVTLLSWWLKKISVHAGFCNFITLNYFSMYIDNRHDLPKNHFMCDLWFPRSVWSVCWLFLASLMAGLALENGIKPRTGKVQTTLKSRTPCRLWDSLKFDDFVSS